MNYTSDIPYLYGELNKQIEVVLYKGKNTETANTVVDNKKMTISVDVKRDVLEQIVREILESNQKSEEE